MSMKKFKTRVIVTACSMALMSMSALAADATTSTREGATTANPPANSRVAGNEHRDTIQQVTESTKVVRQMERDTGMRKILQQAQGVFIVPDYGRAALGVGARGGEGVLLVKRGSKWSDPAFYNIGGVSVGVQAGAEAGAIAMVLNNQKAVNSFMQNNNWSLNADSGLTIVNWSKKAQGSVGKGDVTVWADTEGLLGDLAVSVSDINFDEDETAGFYGKQVALKDIFSGKVKAPKQVASLKQALPTGSGATSTGSSAGATRSGTGSKSSHGTQGGATDDSSK
jgi:lipid-binding SYLF domain-containing protein